MAIRVRQDAIVREKLVPLLMQLDVVCLELEHVDDVARLAGCAGGRTDMEALSRAVIHGSVMGSFCCEKFGDVSGLKRNGAQSIQTLSVFNCLSRMI